jgi:hypothetical protein
MTADASSFNFSEAGRKVARTGGGRINQISKEPYAEELV